MKDIYDKSYEKSENFTPSASLLSFIKKDQLSVLAKKNLRILEVGCGNGSVLEGLEGLCKSWTIKAIDSAKTPIINAKKRLKDSQQFTFEVLSISELEDDQEYDLVIDSHLLHCLTEDNDRLTYWQKINQVLRPGGALILETMVAHENMSFDFDQYMDFETSTLFQDDRAIRRIKDAQGLEVELKHSKLEIFYLEFFETMQFIAHSERLQVHEGDPEVMRALLFKPKTM